MFCDLRNSIFAFLLLGVSIGHGEDWPQFRGPNMEGKSTETGLLKSWPPEGPALLWETDGLGSGWSSAAISQGTVFITGLIDKQGYVSAFDLSGKLKWKVPYGPEWTRSFAGSRSTPTVEGNRFYLMSGLGVVTCHSSEDGKVLWSFDPVERYKGQYPLWGISENIVIDGDNLICTPGGEIASVVALNKKTGEVVWECRELQEESTYCSPRIFDRGDKRILVTMLKDSVVGLDARTGKLLWKDGFDGYHTDRKRTVNANIPIYHEGRLFSTSGYNNGGAMLELNADGTAMKQLWTTTVLDTHHGGVLLMDGYLYGSNWLSNNRGNWACLRWADGQAMYDSKWNGNKGSIIYVDGMFYCYDENNGDVGLVQAKPEAFEVVSSFKITKGKGKFWAHPSISDGRLYLRHGEYLMVYDISKITHNTSDPDPDGVTDFNPMKLYTSRQLINCMHSQGKTLQIYLDDFKLWKNRRPTSFAPLPR